LKPNVLIVCGANQDRSPALAAMLRRRFGDEWHITSAGLEELYTGLAPSEHTLACMRKRHIDLEHHRSQPVWNITTLPDVMVCLTPAIRDTILQYLPDDLHVDKEVVASRILVPNEASGGIPDPHGGNEEKYEACFERMEALLPELIDTVRSRLGTN